MTQRQAEIAEQLAKLAETYPQPSEDKLERRLQRIDRMANFYSDKAPLAPERQAQMFEGFVSALLYAQVTIKMYRKLTRLLFELAQEASRDE